MSPSPPISVPPSPPASASPPSERGQGRGFFSGPLSGTFYRIIFAHDAPRLLAGAISPEGRFHHSGQAALYMSPTPEAAALAVARYVRPTDPPRSIARLLISDAWVLDIRQPQVKTALGLGDEASVPWQDQRAVGQPARSWRASDAVRATGTAGMIYASRTEPSRWHLVLFRWNQPESPLAALVGPMAGFPLV